jgi:hypothetical protein
LELITTPPEKDADLERCFAGCSKVVGVHGVLDALSASNIISLAFNEKEMSSIEVDSMKFDLFDAQIHHPQSSLNV